MKKFCSFKAEAEGIGMCDKKSCKGCRHGKNMKPSKSKAARDIRMVPTQNTLAYIQGLIAYKRTHISREQNRLAELETMEQELLNLVK